jgi:hypothetical protein
MLGSRYESSSHHITCCGNGASPNISRIRGYFQIFDPSDT